LVTSPITNQTKDASANAYSNQDAQASPSFVLNCNLTLAVGIDRADHWENGQLACPVA
jgi:hypothetical protein